jgi:ketosteroid isomerase-like protein
METIRRIRDIVAAINQAWVTGDYEAIGQYVAEHVVMAPPDLDGRVLGREAYVASFRQFAEVARTREFDPAHNAGEWRVVWRTVLSEPEPQE